MRLHKCRQVEQHLTDHSLVDARRIWCYVQLKILDAKGKTEACGFALACIKDGTLFLYETCFNSTELTLAYTCSIQEMDSKQVKKGLFSTTFSFVYRKKTFRLDMDDWKRFSAALCG